MACPFLLARFDPRQVGALPRRPRLPSSRATGAAFFAEIVHRTISDRSSPPRQARFRASPKQARPDYRRQAWGTPLACGLKRDEAPMHWSAHGAPFSSCRICPSTNPAAPACPWAGAIPRQPQAGAAGFPPWGVGHAPCRRAEALRQSDCENAPQERFQSVLWARSFQPRRAVSREIFALCLRLAQGHADTYAPQDCDAMFPPIISTRPNPVSRRFGIKGPGRAAGALRRWTCAPGTQPGCLDKTLTAVWTLTDRAQIWAMPAPPFPVPDSRH